MKKYISLPFLISFLSLPFFALAQSYSASDTIALPPSFIDNMWAQASLLFTSLSSYTEAIIGVLLALVVIGEVVYMIRKPN